MEHKTLFLVTALFAAHCVGDFLLQSSKDARNKKKPLVLLKHSAIHAALAWLFAGYPSAIAIPLLIFFTHAIIDLVKALVSDSLTGFVVDQLAHIGVIALIPTLLEGMGGPLHIRDWMFVDMAWINLIFVHLAGIILTANAGSFFLAKFVEPYQEQLQQQLRTDSGDEPSPLAARRGLENAGSTIGKLERFLVYLLVHSGQPAGIGFLVAAKSIFRFGELRDTSNRMESEYIIIGTLASFSYAITIAYVFQWWHSLIR